MSFSDTRMKSEIHVMCSSFERIKQDIETIRDAQIEMNKKFSYLDERMKVIIKSAKKSGKPIEMEEVDANS
jgi:predicted transcriptional regulator